MNDFGVNLKGKVAIFKRQHFYRPGANRNTRSFLCEGGNGCDPKAPGRTITGKWIADEQRDTVDSYDFESYIDDKGKEIENPGFKMKQSYTPPLTSQEPEESVDVAKQVILLHKEPAKEESKTIIVVSNRKTFDAEEAIATAVVNKMVEQVDETLSTLPAPPEVTPVTEEPKHRGRKSNNTLFTPERVIELFKQGKRIVDIAVELGYERGQGQNRTRAVLKAAGLVT